MKWVVNPLHNITPLPGISHPPSPVVAGGSHYSRSLPPPPSSPFPLSLNDRAPFIIAFCAGPLDCCCLRHPRRPSPHLPLLLPLPSLDYCHPPPMLQGIVLLSPAHSAGMFAPSYWIVFLLFLPVSIPSQTFSSPAPPVSSYSSNSRAPASACVPPR